VKHDNNLGSGSDITIFSVTTVIQMLLNTYCWRYEFRAEGVNVWTSLLMLFT